MTVCIHLQLNQYVAHFPFTFVLVFSLKYWHFLLFPQYRDIVRQFIKGTDGFSGGFAECLCGSPHLYQVCCANTCRWIQRNATWISCCIWPRSITLELHIGFDTKTYEWRKAGLFSYLFMFLVANPLKNFHPCNVVGMRRSHIEFSEKNSHMGFHMWGHIMIKLSVLP